MKRLCLLELNEFNLDLLRSVAEARGLRNLQALLRLPHTCTTTNDREPTGFLEPWAQWVSVHTGTTSETHGIKHLGDVDKLSAIQVWEELSNREVTSGAWGVMNGTRRSAKNCKFFLPDPWTFSEPGHPARLTRLLALPRYVSKNYLSLSKRKLLGLGAGFLWVLLTSGITLRLLAELPRLGTALRKFGAKHFVFISFFESLSTLLFLRHKHAHDPQLSVLFLNSVAHAQHHHWTHGATGPNDALDFVWSSVDRCVGWLRDSLRDGEALVVMNGLSQTNTNAEDPWILYRAFDPGKFLVDAGVEFVKNEPLMTYDCHLFLASPEHRDRAFEVLRTATVADHPLFFVENDGEDPRRLFYRVDFSKSVDDDIPVHIHGRELRFGDHFCAIVQRTGRHIPRGDVFSEGIELPTTMPNHEMNRHILEYF